MHCVRSPSQHHLCVEGREMSLWVLYTCKGGFKTHERGWYHDVYDRLQKRHWESLRWCGWRLFIHHMFPCLLLQIPAQFLIGPAQFFISCLRRNHINLDAFLIHYWCRHRFLKGVHRLHDLLHGDALASIWCDGSLPRVSHIDESSLYAFEWDKNFDRAPRWAPNVPTGWLDCPHTSNNDHTPNSLCLRSCFLSIKHPEPAKPKGGSRGRLHSDAQVNTGAMKQKCVSLSSSQELCKRLPKTCVPCEVSYYPLYSLGFPLFPLPAFRGSEGMP